MPCTSSSSTASVWLLDLGERQFLAQLVTLAAVAGEVDRLGVQERLVEPIELLLDRLDAALLLCGSVLRFGSPLLPRVEDAVLHQAHVAMRRLFIAMAALTQRAGC